MKKNILTFSILMISIIGNAQVIDSECKCNIQNASYTGVYKGVENNLNHTDLSLDLKCASLFREKKYPNGFLTIFGSSRIKEKDLNSKKSIAKQNDYIYKFVKEFAYLWTKKNSTKYPILTGAGPGIMEAGSRGAFEAGGPSIGYTTYYGDSRNEGGKSELAFQKYNNQNIITDGLIFSSVATREYAMIVHSAAMIFAPGGSGTEWEIFQTIEKIKSSQLNKIPIFLIGNKKSHWKSLYSRIEQMVEIGAIKSEEFEGLIVHIESTPEDLVNLIEWTLKQK